MKNYLKSLFGNQNTALRSKILGILALVLTYNLLVWCWAFYALHTNPFLLSTALLAYTFGLTHAVDADHIAAIDNVTRKLLQEGKQPVAAGLFFSLGHSSVVFIATIGVVLTTTSFVQTNLIQWQQVSSVICTSISALFLFLIALINFRLFIVIYQQLKQVKTGQPYCDNEMNHRLNHRGFLGRYFRGGIRLMSHSWQMFPLGFILGIGFDTATEVTLLGITAAQAFHGISMESILIFPALFTAGMTFIDTVDCIIMLGVYGWAYIKPIRKLYYNLTITLISVIVAVVVGGIEVAGLMANQIKSPGLWLNRVIDLNHHFNRLGYLIILFFLVCWLVSIFVYRLTRHSCIDRELPLDSQYKI